LSPHIKISGCVFLNISLHLKIKWPENFYMLMISLKELKRKRRIVSHIGKGEVVVCWDGKNVFAFSGFCPHQGGPLAKGRLKDNLLFCPWHGCCFDLGKGICVDTGSCRNVRKEDVVLHRFKCVVTDGMVCVDEA